MTFSVPLFMLLAITAQAPGVERGTQAAMIAPFLGDDVGAVVHIDLSRFDAPSLLRNVAGNLVDDDELGQVAKGADDWFKALRNTGAKDLFVLITPDDLTELPLVVVPLEEGTDGGAVAELLTRGGRGAPARWPASEAIRGAQVAGTPAALARLRAAKPSVRPEFMAAFNGPDQTSVHVILIPSTVQRRAIEESLPNLPPELGGKPITTLTQGLRWASFALAGEPKPTLRITVQANGADAAKALQALGQAAYKHLVEQKRDPVLAEVARPLGQLTPEVQGDRITIDADLAKVADLVALPVQKARSSALRSQCVNNLKQIGLAMHNYHDKYNAFPPAYSTSREGKPLLSWRVQLLPYLEQQALYKEFKLDEPWDSPHNKPLIAKMPPMFACPAGSRKLAREGLTCYLTPRGPHTIFPGPNPIKLQEITDGTSNTIFVLEANDNRAVPWTKPDDWEVPAAPSLQDLTGHHPGGTNAAFADGSVHFLKETIDPELFLHLLTRNGGEVISADRF